MNSCLRTRYRLLFALVLPLTMFVSATLAAEPANQRPAIRSLVSFAEKNPFSGATVVAEHAPPGAKALRLESGYALWEGPQDWSGYDYLKADVYADAERPLSLNIEIRDRSTRDYWTRVNYETLLPPGKSTLVVPIGELFVGEKARPGRKLLVGAITHLVFGNYSRPAAPIYIANLRLRARHGNAKGDVQRAARLFLRAGRRATNARLHARRSILRLQLRPRLWAEECMGVAGQQRAPARSAVRKFPRHPARLIRRRFAEWPLPRVHQHRQSVRFLGRIPELPTSAGFGAGRTGGR